MIAADLPVDTAGAAGRRVEVWQPYEFTKWSNKEFEAKADEQAAHEAYRTMLQSTSSTEVDDILWVSMEGQQPGYSEGIPHLFRHHIPPDARFQRTHQKVAEASKSGRKH